jgi:FHA domain
MLVTVAEKHNDESHTFKIDLSEARGPLRLGRAHYCDHVLIGGDLRMSRVQATLYKKNDIWYLRDGCLENGESRTGIYCSGKKIEDSIKLTSGMSILLYRSAIGIVNLTVQATQVSLLTYDTDSGDPVEHLRREIAELRSIVIERDSNCEERLIELKAEFDLLKASSIGREAIFEKVETEINALFTLFEERFAQLDKELRSNQEADRKRDDAMNAQRIWQSRIIGVLATCTIGLSTWIVTNGNIEVMKQILPYAAGIFGLGVSGQAIMQQKNK